MEVIVLEKDLKTTTACSSRDAGENDVNSSISRLALDCPSLNKC